MKELIFLLLPPIATATFLTTHFLTHIVSSENIKMFGIVFPYNIWFKSKMFFFLYIFLILYIIFRVLPSILVLHKPLIDDF